MRTMQKLAEMLQRCERQTWTLWARLLKAGWIAYRILRARGRQYIEFWPLVRVQERAPSVFVGRETALSTAPSEGENCTLGRGTPYRPRGTAKLEEQQTAGAPSSTPLPPPVDPVVVSLLTQEVGEPLAKALAADSEARKQGGLTAHAVRHVLGIFQAQNAVGKIANPGAWLRCALRRHDSYLAPAPPPTHPSERPIVALSHRVLLAPPKPLPPPTDPTLKRLLEGFKQRSEAGHSN